MLKDPNLAENLNKNELCGTSGTTFLQLSCQVPPNAPKYLPSIPNSDSKQFKYTYKQYYFTKKNTLKVIFPTFYGTFTPQTILKCDIK